MLKYLSIALLLFCTACAEDAKLFTKISPENSGISFTNLITETLEMNIIDEENIYNGGGVGVGDFNNDGLMDLYFTGNMVENKLYLNKGAFQFEDITVVSGTQAAEKWSRGVAVVDINGDGWQDIYVSCTILDEPEQRENLLFVNQGAKDGVPIFKELASAYGLNSNKHTTQASFFDYDNDGDLDIYLANNVFGIRDNPNGFRKRFVNGEHPSTDQLFRHDFDSTLGHPVFKEVSQEAGILQEGYSHSVITCDINRDGWTDVFVANDYLSENLFYLNNQDGTFTNRSKEILKHTAFNAMGADVIDLNNDNLDDIVELDMNPEDNYRKKTMLGGARYEAYQLNLIYNYQFQYIRNMLHLNQGGMDHNQGIPLFSEVSFYAGIAETDWSWTPLVADFDLDGWKDIIITNGFPKDVTDHDFMSFRNSAFGMNDKAKLLSLIPEIKISNYAYHNQGGYKFADVTEDWGIKEASFSNGAAVADLDNDGDLDVVINNINAPATLYQNKATTLKPDHHSLTIKLKGPTENPYSLGTRLRLIHQGQTMTNYSQNVRGYLSSNDPRLHFGVGAAAFVDTVFVEWVTGSVDTLSQVPTDQILEIAWTETETETPLPHSVSNAPYLTDISEDLNLEYVHQAKDINDYRIQRTLPHKYSQLGPKIISADFNGDGLEDFIINQHDSILPALMLQSESGFVKKPIAISNLPQSTAKASTFEVLDIDGDEDMDIIVGLCEYENLQHKTENFILTLINDGNASFENVPTEFKGPTNVSTLKAIDLDADGKEDLFVGCQPGIGQYPRPTSSYIFHNASEKGTIRFLDITSQQAPALLNIGIVNDAEWGDFDGDNDPDLVLAGDYMPVTLIVNEEGMLKEKYPLTKKGWWKGLEVDDIDRDGKPDLLLGNYGLNSSLTVRQAGSVVGYYQDNDSNGIQEVLMTRAYKDERGRYKRFWANSRNEVTMMFPEVKKKHLQYESFASSSMEEIFDRETFHKFQTVEAEEFRSGILRNLGHEQFEFIPFPEAAQLAPIFDFQVMDLDHDGQEDLLVAGNYFGTEVFNGRQNAFNGLALKNIGAGLFEMIKPEQSGFIVKGDAKDLSLVKRKTGDLLITSQHNDQLKLFKINP